MQTPARHRRSVNGSAPPGLTAEVLTGTAHTIIAITGAADPALKSALAALPGVAEVVPDSQDAAPITRNLRVVQNRPLVSPAILLEELPLTAAASAYGQPIARRDGRDPRWRRRPPDRRRRPLLDPRSGRRARLRPATRRARRRTVRRPADHHAGLFREAAHDRRLEGADQRPEPRREFRRQYRPAPRPQNPARYPRPGAARRLRIPRPDLAAILRRRRHLGRDRRADDGEPGPPRGRLRPLDAGRVQERHRRRDPDGRRCGARRRLSAPVPRRHRGRAGGDRRDARQSGWPRDPARRHDRHQLRRGECRDGPDDVANQRSCRVG